MTSVTLSVTARYSDTVKFVVRRAFRRGAVTRAELIAAFGLVKSTATRVMQAAQAYHPDILIKAGRGLGPKPGADAPGWAGEDDLLSSISAGLTEYARTGLMPEELPVLTTPLKIRKPLREGLVDKLVAAIVGKRPVLMRYVGLKRGERGEWRTVLPVAIELQGEQLRLLACDVPEIVGPGIPPVKVFVLTRITGVKHLSRKLPKGFIPPSAIDSVTKLSVTLSNALTAEQAEVLRYEMGLNSSGMKEMPSRLVYEFKRKYAIDPPPTSAVWPLASKIEVA